MPVHHRLRFLTFPMRASRLCSLWPDMRPLRFRRVPFGRDVAFDPGGATASRIAMPHILPSTVPSVSASARLLLSWLNPPPHPITVYASHPPSPTTAQHSAVPVRQSVRRDYVVCLDCGYRGKILRRHLAAQHGLSRDQYRQRWELRSDHPLTVPA